MAYRWCPICHVRTILNSFVAGCPQCRSRVQPEDMLKEDPAGTIKLKKRLAEKNKAKPFRMDQQGGTDSATTTCKAIDYAQRAI